MRRECRGWQFIGESKEGHDFKFYPVNEMGKWGMCMIFECVLVLMSEDLDEMCVVGMLVYMVHLIIPILF